MNTKSKNYEVQTKLGSGSYGVIFRALNKKTHKICVLKQISLGRLSQRAKKSAVNQATIMGKLIHPFIVRYHESFIENNTLNIVMEYCDNGDLSVFLKMQNKKPLKEEKIWKFFIQICMGLQYIHKNKILHRDIKTLNIFLNKNEELKIGDLGVAKMLTSNQFANTMVGTPFYLSPQLCEEKPYNEKSDIWALGCLLYELCTFRHPFEAQNQASLILKIIRGKYNAIPQFYSKQLKDMISICLERDYKRRPTAANILARPKIQQLIKSIGMTNVVDNYYEKINQEEKPKPLEQNKAIRQSNSKDKKPASVKPEAKEKPSKKQLFKKEEKLVNKQIQRQNQQKIAQVQRKQNQKKDFQDNLNKLIDEDQKKGKNHLDIPWKKKEEKIIKVTQKIQQIKNIQKCIDKPQTPYLSNEKKRPSITPTPVITQRKNSKPVIEHPFSAKPVKAPLIPPKPPIYPKQENITKVKVEKVVQPKVYESQKNVNRSSALIKSRGFIPTDVKQIAKSNTKDNPNEKKSRVQQKKPSIHEQIKNNQKKNTQKDQSKVLFGYSPTFQHKSEKILQSNNNPLIFEEKKVKKEQHRPIARVRKGYTGQLARNAKNASRYNEISKQEEDLVMNLPNNNDDSSDSQPQQSQIKQRSHMVQDIKAKTNKKFRLKEIDDELVLQKYEDIMQNSSKSQFEGQSNEESQKQTTQKEGHQGQEKQQEFQLSQETPLQKYASCRSNEIKDQSLENISQQIDQNNRKDSNQPIEQLLEAKVQDQLQQQFEQDIISEMNPSFVEQVYQSKHQSEWSFDEEPQLPMLQQKQEPYFQQNNPYLEEQEETVEDKKNHLQLKLKENMKREDELNKLMQIKIEECKSFLKNDQSFQDILEFFRKKINKDDEYTEEDEKQVQIFLKKRGLTDHRKFQNIYKIMHFEMQLENTRTIIQRICKKMNELQQN